MAMDRAPDARRDRIALDRSPANRSKDADGHLHVKSSNISGAAVNPYYGREIPDYEELGLEPDKIYQLFRDPAEIKKAAASFHGKPLMIVHKAQTAQDHDREVVVGSVHNPTWADPFLKAELVIWDGEAISAVENGEQKDLSAGYRYKPVMEPGEYNGVAYQGRMTALEANHVALVGSGRVEGAVVGDAALTPHIEERPKMAAVKPVKKLPLSRRALAVSTALGLGLKPRLAQDAQIDLRPLVEKITAKNWKASKPKLVEALKAATAGKLAQDADLQDVVGMLDMLDEVAEEVDMVEAAIEAKPVEEVNAVVDADPMAKIMEMLAGMLSPEQMAQVKAAMEPEAAADEKDDATAEKDDKGEKDGKKPPPFAKDKDGPPMTKAAMDAAIAKAKGEVEASTIARMEAVQTAKDEVKPFIGALDKAPPNAAEIYKMALDHLEIDVTGVDPSAYGALVRLAAKQKAETPAPKPKIAQDAAGAASFLKMFPGAANIRAA